MKVNFRDHVVVAEVGGGFVRVTHRAALAGLCDLHPDWDGTVHVVDRVPAVNEDAVAGRWAAVVTVAAERGLVRTWNVDRRVIQGGLPADPRDHVIRNARFRAGDPVGAADQLARTLFASHWPGTVPHSKLSGWRSALVPFVTADGSRAAQLALVAAAWEAAAPNVRRKFPLAAALIDIARFPAPGCPPAEVAELAAAFRALGVPGMQRDQLRNFVVDLAVVPTPGWSRWAGIDDPGVGDQWMIPVVRSGDASTFSFWVHAVKPSPAAAAEGLIQFVRRGGNLDSLLYDYDFTGSAAAIFCELFTRHPDADVTKTVATAIASSDVTFVVPWDSEPVVANPACWIEALIRTGRHEWVDFMHSDLYTFVETIEGRDADMWPLLEQLWALLQQCESDRDGTLVHELLSRHSPEVRDRIVATFGAKVPSAPAETVFHFGKVRGAGVVSVTDAEPGDIERDPLELWMTESRVVFGHSAALADALKGSGTEAGMEDLRRLASSRLLPASWIAAHVEDVPELVTRVFEEMAYDGNGPVAGDYSVPARLRALAYRAVTQSADPLTGAEIRVLFAALPEMGGAARDVVRRHLLWSRACPDDLLLDAVTEDAADTGSDEPASQSVPAALLSVPPALLRVPRAEFGPREHLAACRYFQFAAWADSTPDENGAATAAELFDRLPVEFRAGLLGKVLAPEIVRSASWSAVMADVTPRQHLLLSGAASPAAVPADLVDPREPDVMLWAAMHGLTDVVTQARALLRHPGSASLVEELCRLIPEAVRHARKRGVAVGLLDDVTWSAIVGRPGTPRHVAALLAQVSEGSVALRAALQVASEWEQVALVKEAVSAGRRPDGPVSVPDPETAALAFSAGWDVRTVAPHATLLSEAARAARQLQPRLSEVASYRKLVALTDMAPFPYTVEEVRPLVEARCVVDVDGAPEEFMVRLLDTPAALSANATAMRNCTYSNYRGLLASGAGVMLAVGAAGQGHGWRVRWNAWVACGPSGWRLGEVNSVGNSGLVPAVLVEELERRVALLQEADSH